MSAAKRDPASPRRAGLGLAAALYQLSVICGSAGCCWIVNRRHAALLPALVPWLEARKMGTSMRNSAPSPWKCWLLNATRRETAERA
jgi:hypothetical protein